MQQTLQTTLQMRNEVKPILKCNTTVSLSRTLNGEDEKMNDESREWIQNHSIRRLDILGMRMKQNSRPTNIKKK